jgi:subtilisin
MNLSAISYVITFFLTLVSLFYPKKGICLFQPRKLVITYKKFHECGIGMECDVWSMMDTNFLQVLVQQIESSRKKSNKHIIHFRAPHDYRKCIAHLKSKKRMCRALAFVKSLDLIYAVSCSIQSGMKLRKYREVLCVEEDSRIHIHPHRSSCRATPTSSVRKPDSLHIPWGVEHVKAPDAWNHSSGQRIRIGVIDTGIDFNHPDLRHAIGKGINLLYPHMLAWDDNGHGTHIAGTIAGSGLHKGIIGVAPKATIHPVKAFDQQGSAYVSDIIRGIEWCVQHKINIINMSFGMKMFNKSLRTAIVHAYRSGTVIVASSGNDGRKSTVDFPARFPQVVSVGATTRKETVAKFTNRNHNIDVYAPGERIYSTWLHGKYHEMSGTSMATAHVSGVTALMLSLRPRMSVRKVKLILKRTAIALKKNSATQASAGQVNARRAINALKQRKLGCM